jgi:hypothetical protein
LASASSCKEDEDILQQEPLSAEITPLVQRQLEKEEEILHGKGVSDHTPVINSNVESTIVSMKGSGQPFPPSIRAFFDPRFGYDFSGVRVHNDSRAANLATSVNAKAFTIGRDVVFGAWQYKPESSGGRRLLAHELTHVVQQKNGGVEIQREETIAHECREGEGPPAMESDPEGKGPHLLIHRGETRKRSRRPSVGDAQQLLNRFLSQLKTGDFICEAGADTEEIQRIRKRLNQDPLEVDCRFGPNTYLVTVMFQRCVFPKDPSEWDGKIGPKTWPQLDKLRTTTPPPSPPSTPPVQPPPTPTPGKCHWPPQNPTLTPVPQKYSSIDPILLSKLKASYIAHRGGGSTPGNDFLANGFWGCDPADKCSWPQTLWEALDKMGPDALDTINRVCDSTKLYSFLWPNIERIRDVWTLSSSFGFEFFTTDETSLEEAIKRCNDFCRDDPWAECEYHHCQRCYREVGRLNVEGLHVCFGKGLYPNIHIDPHQIAERKEQNGMCKIDWIAWGRHAIDVVAPGWDGQTACVIAQGACFRPGGLPSDDDIRQYNEYCRKQTGYKGPDIRPDCEKEKSQ